MVLIVKHLKQERAVCSVDKTSIKKNIRGYNPIGYALRIGEWLTSSDSFIFSFECCQDTKNMKIGRVINPAMSVWENRNWSFFNFGSHLYLNKQNLYLGNDENYNNIFDLDIEEEVRLPIEKIEEIEVFSVLKY